MKTMLTRAAIQEIERKAEEKGVSKESLMENAGETLAEQVYKMLPEGGRVAILCGGGNNGGDGLVCARQLLLEDKFSVSVILCAEPKTSLARQALKRLPKDAVRFFAERQKEKACSCLEEANLILDAVFGFGFHGEIEGVAEALIAVANRQTCKKLAADLPSGTVCDTGAVSGTVFRADVTLTFHALKPACVTYPAKAFCGDTVVQAVGVPPWLVARAPWEMFVPEQADIRMLLPMPDTQSNKGSRGRLLLVCGSYGMAGACVLAAQAALRSGVGLLEIFTSERLYPILAAQVPEAVFSVAADYAAAQAKTALETALARATACVLGCGLGEDAQRLCGMVLKSCKIPLLVDADGLNFLSRHPERSPGLPADTVLTPHPGELSRLMGMPVPEIQANRLEAARGAAKKLGAVLLLKGAGTVVATPAGTAAVNHTGNPGMAKGGSGDALSGIIGALLAQDIPAFQAAYAGAYIHGLAGDYSVEALSMRAALPTDFIQKLPEVYHSLEYMDIQ